MRGPDPNKVNGVIPKNLPVGSITDNTPKKQKKSIENEITGKEIEQRWTRYHGKLYNTFMFTKDADQKVLISHPCIICSSKTSYYCFGGAMVGFVSQIKKHQFL
mmetsp:Transcript_8540/g.9846  ORF Transcript_8540/g.9846 Transcript_8540/m.9846 type:complete len:104 (+) Transcript_8540:546-857(+)